MDAGWAVEMTMTRTFTARPPSCAEEMSKTPLKNLESNLFNIFYAIICQTFWRNNQDVISKTLLHSLPRNPTFLAKLPGHSLE